jgi:hypothetical protein
MDWYVVVKTINGHRYFYRQKTYRDGAKVRTVNKYLGPAGESAPGAPIQLPLPLTTTQSVPTKEHTTRIAFDRKKADHAFELMMGAKAADWNHHWSAHRHGPVQVKRNRQIDGLLRKHAVRWSHNTTGCFYAPARDIVNIPPVRCFEAVDGQSATSAYYVVVLHEVVHYAEPSIMPHRSGVARKARPDRHFHAA